MREPKRSRRPVDPVERFMSQYGWCGKRIGEHQPVFGGGAKARPGLDVDKLAGHVLSVELVHAGRSIDLLVSMPGSDARRKGDDLVYLACSAECARKAKAALAAEVAPPEPG